MGGSDRRGNAEEYQTAKIGMVLTRVPSLPSPQSPVLEQLNLDLLRPSKREGGLKEPSIYPVGFGSSFIVEGN